MWNGTVMPTIEMVSLFAFSECGASYQVDAQRRSLLFWGGAYPLPVCLRVFVLKDFVSVSIKFQSPCKIKWAS